MVNRPVSTWEARAMNTAGLDKEKGAEQVRPSTREATTREVSAIRAGWPQPQQEQRRPVTAPVPTTAAKLLAVPMFPANLRQPLAAPLNTSIAVTTGSRGGGRASPREMTRSWREERLLEGSLSPRPSTPRAPEAPRPQTAPDGSTGESPRAAQAKLGRKEQLMQHRLFERARQAMELAAQNEAACLEISALRSSRNELAETVAELEVKLRSGEKKSRQRRQEVLRQRNEVAAAEARESEKGEEKTGLQGQIQRLRYEIELRDDRLAEREQRVSELKRQLAAAKAQSDEAFAVVDAQHANAAAAHTQCEALEERAVALRQAHEQARLALMQESETRRAEEAKRLAVEVELRQEREEFATTRLHLQRERAACEAATGRLSAMERTEKALVAAGSGTVLDVKSLRSSLDASNAALRRATAQLRSLHEALLSTHSSLLAPGASSRDPVRLHNEKVLHRLLSVLAATLRDAPGAGEGGDGGGGDGEWRVGTPPFVTMSSGGREEHEAAALRASARLAEASAEQREATQRLIDKYAREAEEAARREKDVRRQLAGALAKLQRYGAHHESRDAVCAILAELVDGGAGTPAVEFASKLADRVVRPGALQEYNSPRSPRAASPKGRAESRGGASRPASREQSSRPESRRPPSTAWHS